MFYGLLNGVFSMDSSVYIETNTYSYFNAPENDVRQPLFGLIAGLVYGPFNCLQWIDHTAYAVFLGFFNPMLIMGGISLLACGVGNAERSAFKIFCCCTFPAILFSLSIEQYAVLWFFLALLVCEILEEKECSGAFTAAAGSLVISGALLPWCNKRKFPDFSPYLKCIFFFAGAIIVCGRTTTILDHVHFRVLRKSYTYQGGYADKLLQYLNFVRTVFIAPSAHMALNNQGIFEWQLTEVTEVSLIGIILVCLSVYSYVINRADKLVKISGMWCVVSAIILGYMGYGTKDNILPLYSLYFGWSYWVLVFSLFRHVGNYRFRRALFATLIGFCALYNIYSFIGMIGQGMAYYPV